MAAKVVTMRPSHNEPRWGTHDRAPIPTSWGEAMDPNPWVHPGIPTPIQLIVAQLPFYCVPPDLTPLFNSVVARHGG